MVHGLDIVFHMDAITVIIFIIFTCFIAIFCASITSNGRSGSSGLGLGSGIPGDRGGGDCLVGGSGHRSSHRGVLLRERSSIQGQRASRQQTILVVRIRESRGHQRRDCDEGCGDHPQQEGTVVDRCLPLTHLVCPLHGKPFAIVVAFCHPSFYGDRTFTYRHRSPALPACLVQYGSNRGQSPTSTTGISPWQQAY